MRYPLLVLLSLVMARTASAGAAADDGLETETILYLRHLPARPVIAAEESMPEVRVSASRYLEEERIGPYAQPAWTTHRRFTTARAYVLPPGQIEFESWWRGTFPKSGGPEHRFLEEIGFGLPYRFQIDVYERLERAPGEDLGHEGNQLEVRWAFADWGKIPLNPPSTSSGSRTDPIPTASR